MPKCGLTITVRILDGWIETDAQWNYVAYVLCEIAGRVYLLERKL